jgi:DNA-binding IclR family transcriptional regulator
MRIPQTDYPYQIQAKHDENEFMSEAKENKGILIRYAAVLDIFAAASGGLTLTEVMNETGLPRGTVHRLLGALLDVGYIESVDGRKVYVLGKRLMRMFHLTMPLGSIEQIVRPILEGLVEQFGETAFLAHLIGNKVEAAATVLPVSENQSFVQPGRGMPIHVAASAKAVFAFQDDALIEIALNEPLVKYTDKAKTDKAAIRAEFATIVEDGFAVCNEELDPGILSYACPVFMEPEGVIYSIGLVGPAQRLCQYSKPEIIDALSDSALEVSALLSSGKLSQS